MGRYTRGPAGREETRKMLAKRDVKSDANVVGGEKLYFTPTKAVSYTHLTLPTKA